MTHHDFPTLHALCIRPTLAPAMATPLAIVLDGGLLQRCIHRVGGALPRAGVKWCHRHRAAAARAQQQRAGFVVDTPAVA